MLLDSLLHFVDQEIIPYCMKGHDFKANSRSTSVGFSQISVDF